MHRADETQQNRANQVKHLMQQVNSLVNVTNVKYTMLLNRN
jgi:hypothetical protein